MNRRNEVESEVNKVESEVNEVEIGDRKCKTRSWNSHSNQTATYLTISTQVDSFTSNFKCKIFLSIYQSFEVYLITLKQSELSMANRHFINNN